MFLDKYSLLEICIKLGLNDLTMEMGIETTGTIA
jgi:hypothetical protein